MNETNPPAIVKEAVEEKSLTKLAEEYKESIRLGDNDTASGMRHYVQAGRTLERIKARVQPKTFGAWIEQHCDVQERQARRYRRLAKNWEELTKRSCATGLSVTEAMKILSEDAQDEEVTSKSGLPFSRSTANEGPVRETGGDEEYQEREAKKQEVLCPRCKRLKAPGCDQCRVKWFNLDNPKPKTDEPAKPTSPAKKKPTDNGQMLFDWQDWTGHFGYVVRGIDRLAVVGNVPNVRPELEALRLRAGELLTEFKRVSELILKQKPPQ